MSRPVSVARVGTRTSRPLTRSQAVGAVLGHRYVLEVELPEVGEDQSGFNDQRVREAENDFLLPTAFEEDHRRFFVYREAREPTNSHRAVEAAGRESSRPMPRKF